MAGNRIAVAGEAASILIEQGKNTNIMSIETITLEVDIPVSTYDIIFMLRCVSCPILGKDFVLFRPAET